MDEGYIKGFQVIEDGKQGVIRITLKYTDNRSPVITGLRRVSKPGLRIYSSCEDMPKVRKGLGIAIVSTSTAAGNQPYSSRTGYDETQKRRTGKAVQATL